MPLLIYNTVQYVDGQETVGAIGSQVISTPNGVSSHMAIEKRISQGPDRIQPATNELPDR